MLQIEPHRDPNTPPPVWGYYKAFCYFSAVANLAMSIGGGYLIANSEQIIRQIPGQEVGYWQALGVTMIVSGLVFGVGNAVLPFLPRKPWIYLAHMFNIIAAGLSCCCLPLALPLFIFWMKPDIREWFEFK